MRRLKSLLIFSFIIGILQGSGQYLEPKKIIENPVDPNLMLPLDLNGNKSVCIRIISPGNEILNVEGNIIGELKKDQESYDVFLTENSKFIKIYPAKGNSVLVTFTDLDKNIELQGGKTYTLYLESYADRKDYFSESEAPERQYDLLEDKLSKEEIEKLAAEGNPDAYAALASMILKSGDTADYKTMYEYYKKAADKGNARGLNGLGIMYDYGYYLTEDKNKAFKYYKEAAEKGFPGAYQNLAACYENGFGTQIDLDKALYYYELAAKSGNKMVFGDLAKFYFFYKKDNPDPEKFKEYVAKGISNDDVFAYLIAGFAHHEGILVPQDYNKAFGYFQKAHELGDEIGTYYMATYYDMGLGTIKNPVKAFMYYKMSAEKGNPMAQFQVGQCYRYGSGTIESEEKAIEWYKKAAEQDWDEAIEALKELQK